MEHHSSVPTGQNDVVSAERTCQDHDNRFHSAHKHHHLVHHAAHSQRSFHSTPTEVDYAIPNSWYNLKELAPVLPVENPSERSLYQHRSLEEFRSRDGHHDDVSESHSQLAGTTFGDRAVENERTKRPRGSWSRAICKGCTIM